MVTNLLIFFGSLFLVVKSATFATTYASKFATSFRLSKYLVGFLVVAFISVLPETLIAVNSAIKGIPEFGLGTLLGSNVADLTLIFTVLICTTGKPIKIQSSILKNASLYPILLLVPIILGLDGAYSRLEGFVLLVTGVAYYVAVIKRRRHQHKLEAGFGTDRQKNLLFLILSMAVLLAGSYFTVESAVDIALALGVSPVFIGMFVVGLGTTMPELIFSLKSHRSHEDSLAVGDILGTVLTDSTIVLGILAVISPFSFSWKITYVTGIFMIVSAIMLIRFMRSGKMLTKKESLLLLIIYILFIFVEFAVSG